MDLDTFIQRHQAEWQHLDLACAKGSAALAKASGPEIDNLVVLYLRASGHLAEARDRFRDPSLEAYLNRVVASAHGALYGGRPASWRSALRLFGPRYRAAVRRTRPFILAAAVLMVCVTAGTDLWVAGSHAARSGVLPETVRQAIGNAKGRRPDLGIAPPALSSYIFINNVQVAIFSFISGVALCIGSLYFVVYNAFILGALAGGYQAAGKSGIFWPLILPHGLLELSAICISAGAGMRLGWALIAPGDRTRSAALVAEGRDAVFVILGVVPAFALAALIEGFITPSGINPTLGIGLGVVVTGTYLFLLFGPSLRRPRPGPVPAELLAAAPRL